MNLIDWIFAGVCINLTRKKEASSNFPRVASPDPKEGRKNKIKNVVHKYEVMIKKKDST